MNKTCMFCQRPLGQNEAVEHFPVGRRLAFDAEKGRLWVVCRECERWNLTPLEERWEAVETCERLFRDTRVRTSTENIGLARISEGLELVRIGAPLRPEFAAWRYGDQFGRRRRRAFVHGGAGLAVVGAIAVSGWIVGGAAANLWWIGNWWINGRTRVRFRPDDGTVIKLNLDDLKKTRFLSEQDEERFTLEVRKGLGRSWRFEADEAERCLGVLLPAVNRTGGDRATVQDAVSGIEEAGHPERFLSGLSTGRDFMNWKGEPGYLTKMPTPTRLALEMALHEEQERRAMEGELWRLERAWEEAEEIAAIADDLLLPEGTEEFIEKHRPEDARRDGEGE